MLARASTRRPRTATVIASIAAGALAPPELSGAAGNPANNPVLLNKPIEDYRYDYSRGRRKKVGWTAPPAHRDHIHIALNWPGAKVDTSFWRSGLWRR